MAADADGRGMMGGAAPLAAKKAVPRAEPGPRDGKDFFAAEVLRLADSLYARALRLTRHAADAEDLVATAVSKAWAHLDTLRDETQFEPWLFRILTNEFVSAWRRRRAAPELEPLPDGDAEDGEADEFSLFERLHQPFLLWWGNPEQEFLNKLLREDLERALASLPEPLRLTVLLVDVEGYAYAEVADGLGIPIGTVRSRINRARGLLQRALWRQAQETGLVSPTKGGKLCAR